MQGVIPDGKWKQQPGWPIVACKVARIANVGLERQWPAIRFEMMIGQQPQLIQDQNAESDGIKERQSRPMGQSQGYAQEHPRSARTAQRLDGSNRPAVKRGEPPFVAKIHRQR